MKSLYFITLIIITTFCGRILAQENQKIIFAGEFINPDKVLLRWVPDSEILKRCFESGYTIVRYKIKDSNGNSLTPAAINNSKTTLIDSLKPNDIHIFSPTDELAKSLDSLHNHFQLNSFISEERNFNDAVKTKEIFDSKHLYYLILADRRFDLAKKMGLGFEHDINNQDRGCTFKYILIANQRNNTDSIIKEIEEVHIPQDERIYDSIANFSGFGINKGVVLEWNFEHSNQFYNYYNFYRSEDGGERYMKINSTPFSYLQDEAVFNTKASYKDTLIANNVTYIYKMEGISIFGYTSPLTDTIQVKGVPNPMLFELPLNPVSFIDTNIVFSWETLAPAYSDSLQQFDIYALTTFNDEPVKINNSPISRTSRFYSQKAPTITAYYYLQAIDQNGYIYKSISVLGQNADTIPPSAPTGLDAEMSKDGTLLLHWHPCPDSDVDGYLVYYANNSLGEFTVLTSRPLKDTLFKEKMDMSFQLDSIALYVVAVDRRFNKSEPSEILGLARPDVVPPSAPVIKHLYPTSYGIRIGWALPTQDKELSFELQRRHYKESDWTLIKSFKEPELTFPVPQDTTFDQASNFLDTTQLEIAPYYYRLMAKDGANNKSYSKSVKVTPYDDGVRGLVSGFTGLLMYQNGSADVPTYEPVQQQNNNNLVPVNTNRKSNRAIRLNWEYTTPLPSSIKEFKIFRKSPQGSNISSPSPRIFTLVATITKEDAARISIIYNLSGYTFFDKNILPTASGPYEYKIMGGYEDGSMSEYSGVVNVNNIP